MKFFHWAICSLILISTPATLSASDYRLAYGDQIKVSVFDEPDLSLTLDISESGTIDYPFLGELEIEGRVRSLVADPVARQGRHALDGELLAELQPTQVGLARERLGDPVAEEPLRVALPARDRRLELREVRTEPDADGCGDRLLDYRSFNR